ncbi:MAG: acyl carrier protein [Caldilineaceae bacterium]
MALTATDVVAILRDMNLPGVYPDFLEPDQSLLTQGIDSLDALTIFTQVEERYGIHIPDADFEKLASIDDIVRYVNEHFAERVA